MPPTCNMCKILLSGIHAGLCPTCEEIKRKNDEELRRETGIASDAMIERINADQVARETVEPAGWFHYCPIRKKEIISAVDIDQCQWCNVRRKQANPPPPVDIVNHPPHYNTGKIEVIEFLEDQKLPYHLANAVKYICRAGKKADNHLAQDLKKAIWYLERYIEIHKPSPRRPNEMKP